MKKSDHSALVDAVTMARNRKDLLSAAKGKAETEFKKLDDAVSTLSYAAVLEQAEGVADGPAVREWRKAKALADASQEKVKMFAKGELTADEEERAAATALESANFAERLAELARALQAQEADAVDVSEGVKDLNRTMIRMYQRTDFIKSLWPSGKPVPGGGLLHVPEIRKALEAEIHRVNGPKPLANGLPSLPGAKVYPIDPIADASRPLPQVFASVKSYVLNKFSEAGRVS